MGVRLQKELWFSGHLESAFSTLKSTCVGGNGKISYLCLLLPFCFSSTGTALQCEVCTGLGHNCTGEMETCPPNHDFCAITMFETEREEIKVHGVVKNCVPSSVCEAGSADINLGKKGRSRTGVFCCKGDACNTVSAAKLPVLDLRLNGLRCPACYASSSESCSDDTVDCLGSESHCIDLAGYVYTGNVFMMHTGLHTACFLVGFSNYPKSDL
ncbi:hypothetical protein JD844_027728 [Phrynosoma platyrhinos]|uniref:UPAR/Ly6 domain-containing protein n=1 Tax=Phrynosoma platyrhinos TaxID=52577 RepID=A0ABQ7SGW3_PHRPL|nr:hypothetical protein JD844_027728 [Phrynosoma platyrhinos]